MKIKGTYVILICFFIVWNNAFTQEKGIFKLPSGPEGPGKFGAYYTHLKYDPDWDEPWRVGDHPDIIIRFEDGGHKFVFWRGTSYIPCWVTDNGIWYTNEFVERRGWHSPNTEGCVEPMSDKQCQYSQVRIIESNEARVVVHWRYAPVDVHYEHPFIDESTGWFDWVDEYYTIYPDATGVRSITVQSTNLKKWIEFHEAIVVNQPGTLPDDNIQPGAVSVANMEGEHHTYYWDENGGPRFDKSPPKTNIYKVNLKNDRGPFALVKPPKVDGDLITTYLGHSDKSIFHWWDHWPVSQDASDGRGAKSSNNPSHTSLCHIGIPKPPPVTCYGAIGDDSFISDNALEWVTSTDSEISMAFYKTTKIGDSILLSFDYANLWTPNLTLGIYDYKSNAVIIELSQFEENFVLNNSSFNTFKKVIYVGGQEDFKEFGEVREIGLTIQETSERKTIKIDNLEVLSNYENDVQNLKRFFDFNLPDDSSPDDIVIDEQPTWEPYFESENKITKLMLHGLTEKKVEDLVPMARSWTDPASLTVTGDGLEFDKYDPEQMAYILRKKTSTNNQVLELNLAGTRESPVNNPVFVVKNWEGDAFDLEINGKKVTDGIDYRYGIEHSLEGDYLVLWNKIVTEDQVQVKMNITSK